MTTNEKIETFKSDMQEKGMYIDLYMESLIEESWQAATTEANKRIAELEGELTDTRNAYHESRTEFYAIQASNNDLRSVLINALEGLAWADGYINSDLIKGKIARIQKMLFSTPAESLQAHDDELIEKCAKVCDHVNQQYSDIFKDTKDRFNDGASYGADDCAECLRALKEVK